VFREHAADDVFVDIDAKGTRNLLCDAGTANTGIAALELDDRVDESGPTPVSWTVDVLGSGYGV